MTYMRPDEYEYTEVDAQELIEHLYDSIEIVMFKVIPEGNAIDPYITGELYYKYGDKRYMVRLGTDVTDHLLDAMIDRLNCILLMKGGD